MANTEIKRAKLLNLESSNEGTVLSKGSTAERPGANDFNAEVLVVAGGGGSGSSSGRPGGGGAGGYRTNNAYTISHGQQYNVTVGTGGKSGNSLSNSATAQGYNGTDSVFDTITSAGEVVVVVIILVLHILLEKVEDPEVVELHYQTLILVVVLVMYHQ